MALQICGALTSQAAELQVTNALNSGNGSLRQIIASAQSGDTITFLPTLNGATISLTSDQILIAKALTIDASGLTEGITINRPLSSARFRLFEIDDLNANTKLKVAFRGVQFTNGASRLGGAILNSEDLELTDCAFRTNRATNIFPNGRGGAIHNLPGSILTAFDVIFESNEARNQGGAVYNLSSDATFAQCLFIGNSSLSNGGAIFNEESDPEFSNCRFLGNETAAYGGAILNISSSPLFKNCSFSRNQSIGEVGGGSVIFNLSSSNPVLLNCTIAGNLVTDTDVGGTIYNQSSSPILKNCILWGNNADIRGSSIDPSSSFNLIEGLSDSANPHFVRDPGVLDSNDYGDLRLLVSSPALDAGDGNMAASMNDSVKDVMGSPRFLGIRIDLGAFEGGNRLNFAFFHGLLDPEGDSNHNGRSNFIDYAIGSDPTQPDDSSIEPVVVSGQQVQFSFLTDAEDVNPSFETSKNLVDWGPLVQGVDYTSSSSETIGLRTIVTFNLVTPDSANPKALFRTRF